MKGSIAFAVLAVALLSACGKGPDQAAAADAGPPAPAADASDAPQPATSADAAAAPITKDSPIWFEPASVSACPGTAATGVVHWNASAFPNVTTVQVTMPAGEGKPDGMFAVSANVGQKETGPWLEAGTEFVLRDNANGAELARAKMPGEPCPQQ